MFWRDSTTHILQWANDVSPIQLL